ncbi:MULTISPECIES: hypothetical protein [Nocardiaceae]|uniref:Uncharacterized protein n=1 Tax=Rhodococcoides yunnanense TaxID=278209 RepID=A0ABU4B966_9NOCA|nr:MULTISPECIES: hypothetical protein [Rhodococcus]MDI9893574.1 hypothetical protein [Rhodococcus sp. IEGM 1381]MDV6260693.1 hypothetical protein [Rhodococcus yunnanensis]
MGTNRRQVLRRRYLSLGLGELAAAGVFLTIALASVVPRLDEESRLALWFALVPLLAVLVQAGTYWLLARSWVESHPMPPSLRTIYRAFRKVDLALLVGGLLGVMVWLPDNLGASLGVLAIWFFGLIEYVNYFAIRLSYPPRLWVSTVGQLRAPRLVRDLNAGS